MRCGSLEVASIQATTRQRRRGKLLVAFRLLGGSAVDARIKRDFGFGRSGAELIAGAFGRSSFRGGGFVVAVTGFVMAVVINRSGGVRAGRARVARRGRRRAAKSEQS